MNREMGLGSHPILPPSLISHTVFVDVKHHVRWEKSTPVTS